MTSYGPKRMSSLRLREGHLARRAAKGDERAFAEIFERYGQELYRYSRAILGNPDDAQDALQNTMTRVLQALPGEKRTIALRPWLYRIARNESLTLIRGRQTAVELTDESAPAEPAVDIRAEHREAVRTLVSDLASLPEIQRSALVLHELSGLSHDEISETLQRSPRASRQAIYEARLALQDLREGRDMNCDHVRATISDGDGRVIRGRRIQSHLRGCGRCSDFALAIGERRTRLGLLAPPLPGVAASGLIASALGGTAATGGVAGAGSGVIGAAGGSIAVKSIAIAGASVAIGLGGAKLAGVDLPLAGDGRDRSGSSEQGAEGPGVAGEARPASATSQGASTAGDAASTVARNPAKQHRDRPQANAARSRREPISRTEKKQEPGSQGPQNAAPESNAGGASALAPSGSGKPESSPGQEIAPDRSSGQAGSASAPRAPDPAGPSERSNAGGASSGHSKPGN